MHRGVAPSVGLAALGHSADTAGLFPGAAARAIAQAALSFVNRGQATPSVVSATAHGIANGVLSAMWVNLLKTIAVIMMAVGLVGAGTALVAQGSAAAHLPLGVNGLQQPQPAMVDPDLMKIVPGPIVRAIPVSKDCMVLAYLPDWNFGNVDNIGIGNNDGGVLDLIHWPTIASEEAASAERQFLIALYSRKTISHLPARDPRL